MASTGEVALKQPRTVVVKNRSAAAIQITAEQIVLEARERSQAQQPPPPRRHVADIEELQQHRLRVRKEFEDRLRMHRQNVGIWMRYAKWEEEQHEIERARSVYERALDIDYRNTTLWMRYAEMEMRSKFINRARNVWDRAVTLLPRMDTLWYKYTYMEEILGNVNAARTLFERWTTFEPPEQAWMSYINLELRAGETERARAVYERFIACHPSQTSYMRYAKWEQRNGQQALARRIYERALEELRDDERDVALFSAFARFEERCKELDRAKVIYKFALESLPESQTRALYSEYVAFEKQYGDAKGVEDVIITKRRTQYEEAVTANGHNYDAWFDYIRMEEAEGDTTRIRDVYERAIANLPPVAEKRYWKRYVYLWINYALFEELTAKDVARTRAVYRQLLHVIPHKQFTFGKAWVLAAKFEVRQKDMTACRKLFGAAIGQCAKPSLLRAYIALELQLGNMDRCRKLYEKFVQLWPFNVAAWTKFAELESSLGEAERARALYDLTISQPALDMPEVAWKAYIDFEIERGELGAVRQLYERLLSRTDHVKVWMTYAAFEASIAGDAEGARRVYSRAYDHFKAAGDDGKQNRALIADVWYRFEKGLVEDDIASGGDGSIAAGALANVENKLPTQIVRRRPLLGADGTVLGEEEFIDYMFKDDETQSQALKLLALGKKFKKTGDIAATLGVVPAPSATDAPVTTLVAGIKRRAAGGAQDEEDDAVAVHVAAAAGTSGDAAGDEAAAAASPRRKMARLHEDAAAGDADAAVPTPTPTPTRMPQSAYDEDDDVSDAEHGKELERELEDVVHATKSAAKLPFDLYTEGDAGADADRDP